MKQLKKLFIIGLVTTFSFGLMVSAVSASMVKKIVLFEEHVSSNEINDYVDNWENSEVTLLKHLPFINGVILSVPSTITSAG